MIPISRTAGRDISGDRDLGRVSSATIGDIDLAARNVVLRGTSDMQCDVLNAHEVLSSI